MANPPPQSKTLDRLRGIVRVTVLGLLSVVVLGCTPVERALFDRWSAQAPGPAAAAAALIPPGPDDGLAVLSPDELAAFTAHVEALEARGQCERYDDWLDEAGLPAHFHDVMRRESNCIPTAYNRSGASGLLQILRTWAGSCGTTPAGLFDPWTNILCGVHVYAVQGGGAWTTW